MFGIPDLKNDSGRIHVLLRVCSASAKQGFLVAEQMVVDSTSLGTKSITVTSESSTSENYNK